jgi:acetate kinase
MSEDSRSDRPERSCILTINGGSSSLKFAVFVASARPERILWGRVERVGLGNARLVVNQSDDRRVEDRGVEAPDHAAAAKLVIEQLARGPGLAAIAAVGHRIVHGGGRFVEAQPVTPAMLETLKRIAPFDPEHLPAEIRLIESFAANIPHAPQFACFDTAFHHTIPAVAQIVPIPQRYRKRGVRRYGFHGLSYAYLMEELTRLGGPEEARGRVILAHLGSGASLAAVREGRCLETTMGFTPASGVVMSTRTGDFDPGLVTFLAQTDNMTPAQFDRMANHESGLLAVSETSPDVRELLARREGDPRAALAIDLFCYHVKKAIGALSTVIGGLDTLVFSGGIGENSPDIRCQVCTGLEFLGISLDSGQNQAGSALISTEAGPTRVRVIATDEESMIAKEVSRLMTRPT